MADPIRIPLVEEVEPRLSDSTKDGLASNIFYDKDKAGNIYATKRSGISNYITGSGQAQGIFYFDGELFIFSDPDMDKNWVGLTYGASKFAALAGSTTAETLDIGIFTSDNGSTWRKFTLPTTQRWGYLQYANGIWVAIPYAADDGSGSSTYATSIDLLTWTERSLPIAATWSGFSATNNVFFLFTGSSTLYTSTDGISWTSRAITQCGFGVNTSTWKSCVWNGSVYCAAGGGGTNAFSTSPDFISWTSRNATGGAFLFITTNGTGRLVAVGSTQAFTYSTDNGVTWTNGSISGANNLRGISWDGTYFTTLSANTKQLYYSTDGTSWTAGASLSSEASSWANLAWNGSKYMIINYGFQEFTLSGGSLFSTASVPTSLVSSGSISTLYYPEVV